MIMAWTALVLASVTFGQTANQAAEPTAAVGPGVEEKLSTGKFAELPAIEGRPANLGETLPARRSPGTLVYDGVLYVAGGHVAADAHAFEAVTFLTSFQAYDLTKGEWHNLAAKPHAGRFSSLVGHGGKIYCFGGFFGETPATADWKSYDVVDVYDIATNQWTTLETRMPHRRSQHAVVQLGEKVYLVGGWDTAVLSEGSPEGQSKEEAKEAHQRAFIRTIDVFDLKTQSFEPARFEMPVSGRRAFSAIAWENKIVISGGFGDKPGSFLNTIDVLDPAATDASQAWTSFPELPSKMIFPMIIDLKGTLYLTGGTTRSGKLEKAYGLFTREDGSATVKQWTELESFQPDERVERTLVRASDSAWLAVGGRFENDDLSADIVEISAR